MFSTIVNLFLRSVSAFSSHGYEVMGLVAQSSFVNVSKTLTLVSNSYRKALINVTQVISDHQSPTKLKSVFC